MLRTSFTPSSILPRRKRYAIFAVTSVVILLLLLQSKKLRAQWSLPDPTSVKWGGTILQQELDSLHADVPENHVPSSSTKYTPGVPLPNHNYTRMVVVPKMKAEDTAWLDEELPDTSKAVYVVDDSKAALHPPKNKGNEAMVYLSYVIDHYDKLPDISIFVHAHQYTWHNNDLLNADTALMIKHLSSARVIREGYMNLRCQWYPGCPSWLHPKSAKEEDIEKKEEMFVAKAWLEIFPHDPVPDALGQPCCSQFALSRDRILAIPLKEYKRLRDWLLTTKLRSSMSGRIFEYLWQYLWTGSAIICPSMHACYCDGFGACFTSEEKFQEWFQVRYYTRQDEWELLGWDLQEQVYENFVQRGRLKDAALVPRGSKERMEELKVSIDEKWVTLDVWREVALKNGMDPGTRAKIAGRKWKEGDGF
jgi:hypothetical protein